MRVASLVRALGAFLVVLVAMSNVAGAQKPIGGQQGKQEACGIVGGTWANGVCQFASNLSDTAAALLRDPIGFIGSVVTEAIGSAFRVIGTAFFDGLAAVGNAIEGGWVALGGFWNAANAGITFLVRSGFGFIGSVISNVEHALLGAVPSVGLFAPILATAIVAAAAVGLTVLGVAVIALIRIAVKLAVELL
jgi:hypothetical protein